MCSSVVFKFNDKFVRDLAKELRYLEDTLKHYRKVSFDNRLYIKNSNPEEVIRESVFLQEEAAKTFSELCRVVQRIRYSVEDEEDNKLIQVYTWMKENEPSS